MLLVDFVNNGDCKTSTLVFCITILLYININDNLFVVKCGKGTYRNDTTLTCEFCAIGSYQTNVGGTVCEPCESSKTTLNFGSDSSTDCIG